MMINNFQCSIISHILLSHISQSQSSSFTSPIVQLLAVNMDPFRVLPEDLRFNFLVSLDSLAEAGVAAQASPALLQQLQETRAPIVHRHVLRDTDLSGDVLQDALAVLKFPRPDAAATFVDAQQRVAAIHNHLSIWGAKEFSNPFHPDTRDVPTMLDLQALCR